MIIPFSAEKLVQAAAVVAKVAEGGRLGRMRLLKLLYIADREALAETARPITGDDAVAMDFGPVLSQTYHFIRDDKNFSGHIWRRHFKNDGNMVELLEDPGEELLSDYEADVLRRVAQKYQSLSDMQLSDLTHDFGEWLKNEPPKGSSRRISANDLLEAVNLGEDSKAILQEARKRRLTQSILAAP